MSKAKAAMEAWISETQMFQRIAKVKESTFEDLEKEWNAFSISKRRDLKNKNLGNMNDISDAMRQHPKYGNR